MRFAGKLYRALNPVWATDPLSGRGAALYGGRFNAKGMPALYCALAPLTAIKEANQVGDLQPTTLVAYDAEIEDVFDAAGAAQLTAFDMTPEALADPGWREAMRAGKDAPTQRFARALVESGYHGLLVRSFARGANETDRNLVLWQWGSKLPAKLTLIDDEGRLRPR